MSIAAYRDQILAARAVDAEAARALWRAGEWHRLAPLLQGWAATGIPLTLGLSGDDIDDLVAKTVVKAWTATTIPDNPGAWCRTVAHRLALDTCKQRQTVELSEEAVSVEPEEPVDYTPIARLRQALRRLDDPMRRCVVLRYLHGRTPEQIAAAVGITVGAVKMRTHRGVRMLARLYATSTVPALEPGQRPQRSRGRAPKPVAWRDLAPPVRDYDVLTRARLNLAGLT